MQKKDVSTFNYQIKFSVIASGLFLCCFRFFFTLYLYPRMKPSDPSAKLVAQLSLFMSSLKGNRKERYRGSLCQITNFTQNKFSNMCHFYRLLVKNFTSLKIQLNFSTLMSIFLTLYFKSLLFYNLHITIKFLKTKSS